MRLEMEKMKKSKELSERLESARSAKARAVEQAAIAAAKEAAWGKEKRKAVEQAAGWDKEIARLESKA